MKNTQNTPEKQPEQGPSRIVFTADVALAEDKNEPWRKLCVKPEPRFLENPNPDPEKDIGRRIALCRAQMDNLSVEALARYTKRFDRDGVSRMAITRYEAGAVPTCRELRILADTLSVPVRWLVFGEMGSDGPALTYDDVRFLESLRSWVRLANNTIIPQLFEGMTERQQKANQAQRQKWLDEDRRPQEKD